MISLQNMKPNCSYLGGDNLRKYNNLKYKVLIGNCIIYSHCTAWKNACGLKTFHQVPRAVMIKKKSDLIKFLEDFQTMFHKRIMEEGQFLYKRVE